MRSSARLLIGIVVSLVLLLKLGDDLARHDVVHSSSTHLLPVTSTVDGDGGEEDPEADDHTKVTPNAGVIITQRRKVSVTAECRLASQWATDTGTTLKLRVGVTRSVGHKVVVDTRNLPVVELVTHQSLESIGQWIDLYRFIS